MAADLAFTINPRTLKLDVAVTAGEPIYDDSRLHKVMSRLAAERGKWWADTTGQRGSRSVACHFGQQIQPRKRNAV